MTHKRALLATSAATLAMLAAPVLAQDTFEDEIIVTATKRQTTLQDTPVAVTVTSADVIEKAQIIDIKDLQSVVPTFRVSQLQNSGNTTLTIRGFGNGGNNVGIEPSVGLFIDGVYRSRAASQIVDLPNLERIEVLSGPQSTLFGKNASAGVVSVITATPDFETNGYIEGGVGNYGLHYAKGYLTGGVTDNVALSLGGGLQFRDGYFDPAPGTNGGDMNDLNRYNIRGQLLWEPSDALTARLIVDRNEIDENCCGVAVAQANGPSVNIINALGEQLSGADGPFSYITRLNKPTQNSITDQGVSLAVEYDLPKFDATFTSITAYRENERQFDSDSDFSSFQLLEDVFEEIDIDTFTQEFRIASSGAERLSWMIGGFYFDETINQQGGVDFGSQARAYVDALVNEPGSTTPSRLAIIEAFTPGIAPGTFFGDQIRVEEFIEQVNESFSLFGTLDFEVTDRLTLTAGGNYTEDRKSVRIFDDNNDAFSNINLDTNPGLGVLAGGAVRAAFGASTNPADPNFDPIAVGFFRTFSQDLTAANFDALPAAAQTAFVSGVQQGIGADLRAAGLQAFPQFLVFPNAVEDGSTKDDDFTYTLKAAYEVNDNLNVYASTATGFKSSSWNLTRNSRPFFEDGAALQSQGLLPANYIVGADAASSRNFGTRFAGPEEATVYEIGLKARFPWGAINIAAFDQTIEGFQSTLFIGTGFVLANAGSQSTQGIEFDSTFTPVDGLRLGFSGILQDPVYDSYTGAPAPAGTVDADGNPVAFVDLSGERPAGINEVSLAFSAQYEFALTQSIDAFIRGDYQYEDQIEIIDNVPGLQRETNQLNAAAGLGFDSGLDLRVWVRNLNNDETFTSGFPGPLQPGTAYGYPNQPRTYGVSLRQSF